MSDVLKIGAHAVVDDEISARVMQAFGVVSNHVTRSHFNSIHATGEVDGSLTYGDIELERGARAKGTLQKK